jgi:glutamyl-tRNA synthetase
VGNARTAIFNHLYAQRYSARLMLRVEDTDRERSTEDALKTILDGLSWLGIPFEGDPVFQSQNGDAHRAAVAQLLESGHAYDAYETPEELKEMQKKAQSEGRRVQYNRNLTSEQRAAYEAEGRSKVVRFKIPEGETTWNDLIRGVQRWDNREIEDFVIQRADGSPVYNLAVVVDDHNMGVTLVMRGADHLSNTPKQILLFRALLWDVPGYAHSTLILGSDGKKQSKRHGATTVTEYKEQGYLPETMFNFLALLGWAPGDGREVFTREELVEAFSIEGLLKKDAVFDQKKLEWLNGEHLRAKPVSELAEEAFEIWKARGWIADGDVENRREELTRIAGLFQDRVRTVQDFDAAGYFFEEPKEYDAKAHKKQWKADTPERMQMLIDRLRPLKVFTESEVEGVVRSLAGELGLSASRLIHPTRLALSGVGFGPGVFELMEALGQETCLRRLQKGLEVLGQNA